MGETGKLEGNIDGMSSVLIDGKVIGNIMADTVCLRNQVNILSFHLCSLCLRAMRIRTCIYSTGRSFW